jgi:isocitrate/isopropylmalate dehydrogenase
MRYRVTLLEGDGIGPEVTSAMRRVLDAAGAPIDWEVMPAGESAAKNHGVRCRTRRSSRSGRTGSGSRARSARPKAAATARRT